MKQILIILGVVLLAIALVVVYFERKAREQNHKIASMFSLVSSLAEELNAMKYKEVSCTRDPETIHIGNQLIDVSDDEMELIEEESSEVESDDVESEVESEDLSEVESETSEDEDLSESEDELIEVLSEASVEVKNEQTKSNIKVLKLDLDSDSEEKVTDFKKMSVGELRTIASQKGIDGTKLKKGELIELLSK
jgi:FtsZ-interacting cell division protein ZipA